MNIGYRDDRNVLRGHVRGAVDHRMSMAPEQARSMTLDQLQAALEADFAEQVKSKPSMRLKAERAELDGQISRAETEEQEAIKRERAEAARVEQEKRNEEREKARRERGAAAESATE